MRNSKLKFIVASFLLLSAYNIKGQERRRDEINFLVKLSLFIQSGGTSHYYVRDELLTDFLKLEFDMDTIESENFDDFIFISINPKSKNPKNVKFTDGPFLTDNCGEFILAITKYGRVVFRLKGYYQNDFANFLMALKMMNYKHLNSAKKFSKNYKVERLDLGCLYSASKSQSIDKVKYPCLLTCFEVISIE